MKTPKEKAKDLYNKMEDSIEELEGSYWYHSAKQCALIAVDEMIEERKIFGYHDCAVYQKKRMDYLNEVKQEIEKL